MENNDYNNNGSGNGEESNGINPVISPIAAVAIGLAAVFFLYHIVGSVITIAIIGMDIKNADMNSVRLLTVAGQLLFILFPAILFSKLFYTDVTRIIRFRLPSLKEAGFYILGLIILAVLLQNIIYFQNYAVDWLANNYAFFDTIRELLDKLDEAVEVSYSSLLEYDSLYEASFIVFIVSVVPAICEEIFFRGYIQKSFEMKIKPWAAIFFTAFFFGMYHFNPYGLIALFGLGAYFGFAAYYSKSIFIPILLHFLNNFTTVLVYFIYGDKEMLKSGTVDPGNIGFHSVSLVIVSVLFIFYIRYIIKNYHKIKGGDYNDMS